MKKNILLITLLALQFTLFAQSGVFQNVNAIRQGQELPVTITGSNTLFLSGSNTAVFYKSGSPTTDLSLKNIVVGSNTLMGGIIEAKVNAPFGTTYTCIIKNAANADVPLSSINLLKSGNGFGSGSFLVSLTTDTIEPIMPVYTLLKGVNTHFGSMNNRDTIWLIPNGGGTAISLDNNQKIALSNTSLRIFMSIPLATTHGWYDLKISNSQDGIMILPKAIYVGNRPGYRLYSVQPTEANRNQTLDIGITGVRTTFNQGSHTLGFFLQGSATNLIKVNSITKFMDTIMVANITVEPNAIPGHYGVVVGNTKYVQYLQESFTVKGTIAVKQVSLSPTVGMAGQTLPVYFTGTYVKFNSGSNTVQFFYQGSPTSMVSASNISSPNETTISANINIQPQAQIGQYTYQVSNSLEPYITSTNTFQVISSTGTPRIISLNPSMGSQGQALPVSITGIYTHFNMGSATNNIQFMRQGSPTADITILGSAIDSVTLGAVVLIEPNAQPGFYDLQVSNAIDGTMSLKDAYYVNASSGHHLVSITPNQSPLNNTLNVSIVGAQTYFSQGSQTLYFFKQATPTTEIFANSYTAVNNELLQANITISPFAEPGLYNIALIRNDDTVGYSTVFLSKAFMVGNTIGLFEPNKNAVDNISLYPNPAQKQFTISSKQEEVLKVEVYDMLGRKLYNYGEDLPTKEIQIQLNDFVLPNQTVFVKIYTQSGIVTKKVLLN